MATVIRANLSAIIPAVLTRLGEISGFPPERVILSQVQELPFNAQADQILWLRIEDFRPDEAIFDGSGRIDARAEHTLAVRVRTRLGLDENDRDYARMLDASLGHLDLVDVVLNALWGFQPTDTGDDTGNWYVTEPMKWKSAQGPQRDRVDPNWAQTVLLFRMVRTADLDQSYQ